MSKMPKSTKKVNLDKSKSVDTIEENKEFSTEIIQEEKVEEVKQNKFNFKDLFTLANLKRGALWFLNSFIWLGIILFIGDMLTKHFAEVYLKPEQEIIWIPGLLKLTLTYNTGAAWGAGGDAMWSRVLLCIISWVAMIGIIYAFVRYYKKLNNWYKAALMMVLAGDVGNLIDRTFFFNRGVIDFLNIQDFIKGFGIFNFADSCLVVGIIFLMILFIIDMFKESKENKKKALAAEAKIKEEQATSETTSETQNKEEIKADEVKDTSSKENLNDERDK